MALVEFDDGVGEDRFAEFRVRDLSHIGGRCLPRDTDADAAETEFPLAQADRSSTLVGFPSFRLALTIHSTLPTARHAQASLRCEGRMILSV